MERYLLTLVSAAAVLAAAYFAIRFRSVNAWIRIIALALSAAVVLFLRFHYDDSSQIYGLGILLIAFVFPLIDVMRHAKKR